MKCHSLFSGENISKCLLKQICHRLFYIWRGSDIFFSTNIMNKMTVYIHFLLFLASSLSIVSLFQNPNSDLMYRSILGHIIPEAMVCYLENYSSDKFAQIFLGEFDTPEAIWNAEMR